MATYSFENIKSIILNNPNADLIKKGRKMSSKLRLHLQGIGTSSVLSKESHFENEEIYKARIDKAISNKDMFARLLQQEELVFTARGGSSHFNLSPEQEKQINASLANVRFNMSLRKWISQFALPAFRSDPMGIIFIEIEPLMEVSTAAPKAPKCYPTYKSIDSIYDYLPNGQKLDYVCFQLGLKEVKQFGINDDTVDENKMTPYFRFVDDAQDVIVKREQKDVIIVESMSQANPIPNPWNRVPGFIISNIIRFDDPSIFDSPVGLLVELADCFLYDRSVRDLQKKYHGFAKAVEPLLKCSHCDGSGFISGNSCPECTIPGQDKGTGFKLRTRIGDVTKFPMEIFEVAGFDVHKIFAYITPDIKSWDKQDQSLDSLESLIYETYWGAARDLKMVTRGGSIDTDQTQETATKSMINLQPKYARLNATADWAEEVENEIADLLGEFWIGSDSWKGSSISYGRNYILETPEDLRMQYSDMRSKGAPDYMLDEALERYYRAAYQNNPIQLAKYLKLMRLEPFPHVNLSDASKIILNPEDLAAKLYFGEWYSTLSDIEIINKSLGDLRVALYAFSTPKIVNIPAPPVKEPAI